MHRRACAVVHSKIIKSDPFFRTTGLLTLVNLILLSFGIEGDSGITGEESVIWTVTTKGKGAWSAPSSELSLL